jgi:hypothetical protein
VPVYDGVDDVTKKEFHDILDNYDQKSAEMMDKKNKLFETSGQKVDDKPPSSTKKQNPRKQRGMFNDVESDQEKFLKKRQARMDKLDPNVQKGKGPEKKKVDLVQHPRIKDLKIQSYQEKD